MKNSSNSSINILHVFSRMVRGGAEMRTLDLMRHVDRNRYKFYFCALSGMTGEFDDEIRSLGGEVYYLKLNPTFFWRFRHLLRQKKFDVVHSHTHMFSGFILRLAAKERISVRIAHFRNTNDGRGNSVRRRIQNQIMKNWIDENATDILAVCEGAMISAWGSDWQTDPRCQVVYNGIDLSKFKCLSDREKILRSFDFPMNCQLFIHIGRMVYQKNHRRIVSIFQKISASNRNARLLMVGRGGNDIEDSVREQINELGLLEKVILTGERSDIPQLLKASDIMIFPSLWEGLPGVVLESCAAGTPVLANDLPGVREIAARVPQLIHILPLEASDIEWASTAERIATCNNLHDVDCTDSINNFSNSIFNIQECVRSLCSVWEHDIKAMP